LHLSLGSFYFVFYRSTQQHRKGLEELLKDNADAKDGLHKKYQLPLAVLDIAEGGEKPFLLCRYNRVGDKYRSPWTNKLYTRDGGGGEKPLEDNEVRKFEVRVNDVWHAYKNLYYGHDAVGSVYLRDSEKGSFEGVFCIQKKCSGGSWDSIHHVYAGEPNDKTCAYKVESYMLTVVLPAGEGDDGGGDAKDAATIDISASLSKEVSKTCKVSPSIMATSHIENVGQIIEDNEIDLRSNLERVYIPKTREIVDDIKKKEHKMPTGVNPLMGMIMGSDVLKKKKLQDS